jgi:hypothetical protein
MVSGSPTTPSDFTQALVHDDLSAYIAASALGSPALIEYQTPL